MHIIDWNIILQGRRYSKCIRALCWFQYLGSVIPKTDFFQLCQHSRHKFKNVIQEVHNINLRRTELRAGEKRRGTVTHLYPPLFCAFSLNTAAQDLPGILVSGSGSFLLRMRFFLAGNSP